MSIRLAFLMLPHGWFCKDDTRRHIITFLCASSLHQRLLDRMLSGQLLQDPSKIDAFVA